MICDISNQVNRNLEAKEIEKREFSGTATTNRTNEVIKGKGVYLDFTKNTKLQR